ncbi:hypothetical protein WKK05_39870 (plasmid) [Nostoc sp. UHCC 0302]
MGQHHSLTQGALLPTSPAQSAVASPTQKEGAIAYGDDTISENITNA